MNTEPPFDWQAFIEHGEELRRRFLEAHPDENDLNTAYCQSYLAALEALIETGYKGQAKAQQKEQKDNDKKC